MKWALVMAAVSLGATAGEPRHDAFGTLSLNGEATKVHWTDGDSFKVRDGPFKGKGTRLVGYNTLEAYGPVHSCGTWTPEELYEIAAASAEAAAAEAWVCTTDGQLDGYHRLLVSCPRLAVEMVRQGYGHAYAVDGQEAAPEVLEAQRQAQRARRGIWRRGLVKGIVTSLHSVDESPGPSATYNRVVDTRTGQASKRSHHQTYRTCQVVCEETEGERSCMVYVPFEHRYRQKPACLR
jgi:endonuclease YncB( thermonuclease family)